MICSREYDKTATGRPSTSTAESSCSTRALIWRDEPDLLASNPRPRFRDTGVSGTGDVCWDMWCG